MADDGRRSPTPNGWRDAATLIAIAGLLVTMVFNTIGVRDNAEQSRQQARAAEQTRLDTAVGVLTSISAYLEQNDLQLRRPEVEAARCNAVLHPLSRRDQGRVLTALGGFDYLAWLFNQHVWRIDAAKRYWAPRMVYALDVAQRAFDYRTIARQFVELEHFRDHLQGAARLVPPCRSSR